jgi:hypothetical protein
MTKFHHPGGGGFEPRPDAPQTGASPPYAISSFSELKVHEQRDSNP